MIGYPSMTTSGRRDVSRGSRPRGVLPRPSRLRPGRGRPSVGRHADGPRFGDGGWKWKGLELGPEANRVADEGLAVRQAAEGRDAEGSYGEEGLTPAMRRVEAELPMAP